MMVAPRADGLSDRSSILLISTQKSRIGFETFFILICEVLIMKQLTDFDRIPLAVLPTPLYKLETLSRELGKHIYIKRRYDRHCPRRQQGAQTGIFTR